MRIILKESKIKENNGIWVYNIMLNKLLGLLDEYLSSFNEVDKKIEAINNIRQKISQHSPFSSEPVDCILWIMNDKVAINDYNPNHLASAEKRLLKKSLECDGFTQPAVAWIEGDECILIDGVQRYSIVKKSPNLRNRMSGYFPVSCINKSRGDKVNRVAATIRHNRARGKNRILSMTDIVRDLHRLGWDDGIIAEELGMDLEEVLRLKQISGLAELFEDQSFSEAWTVK